MKEKKANTGSLISIAVAIVIVTTVSIAQASTVTVNSKDLDKDFSQSLEANVPEGFSIATTGDMMLTHPVPHSSNPGFVGLLNGIKNAEVAFTNFESSIPTKNCKYAYNIYKISVLCTIPHMQYNSLHAFPTRDTCKSKTREIQQRM